MLIRSSYSSNIKERRDCSCALFDETGAWSPRPSTSPCISARCTTRSRAVRERLPEPGDVFVLNDPYAGGTHLPDITLVAPVDVDGEIVGYAVSARAPLGCRRHDARLDAERLALDLPGGHRSSRRSGSSGAACSSTTSGARPRERPHAGDPAGRSAGAGRCERGRRAAAARAASNGTACRSCGRGSTRCSRTRSGGRATVLRSIPDGTYEADGVIEGDGVTDVDIPIRVAVTIQDATHVRRLHRHVASGGRATSTARSRSRAPPVCSRCACCCPTTSRPTRARPRRSSSASRSRRSSTRTGRRPSSRATSRPASGSPTRCSRRSGRRSTCRPPARER